MAKAQRGSTSSDGRAKIASSRWSAEGCTDGRGAPRNDRYDSLKHKYHNGRSARNDNEYNPLASFAKGESQRRVRGM